MPKSKSQKQEDLKELTEKIKAAKAVVLADYRGTTVKNMDKFRAALRKENVFTKVYKTTLLKKALKDAGVEGEIADYKLPVILSFSEEDEATPARAVKTVSKEIDSINILEGVLEGKIVGREMVLTLAGLPSKDQLRGQLVGTINAPVTGFVNVLAGNLRGLINVLNAVAAKA